METSRSLSSNRNNLIGSLIFLALLGLAACGSIQDTPPPGGNVPGTSVSITGATCPMIEINLDDQVTWTNDDTVEHPIRVEYPDTGEVLIDLGTLQPGESASLTFNQAGEYPYICSTGESMTGSITVLP
jgi:hypothetical protein